jgi:hypothetical protein
VRFTAAIAAALLVPIRIASACGAWDMHDVDKHVTVQYLINAASIYKDGKDGARGPRIAALYLDLDAPSGLRVVRERQVVFDIRGDKLLRFGKPIGTLTATGVTIGKTEYAIELVEGPTIDTMPTWNATVRRGADTIVTGERLYAMCRKGAGVDEIRRRIVYYLAWRATGA